MNIKTPGIYVRAETPPVPPDQSIETALPAFIGYTERIAEEAFGLPVVVRITDIGEYEAVFGGIFRPLEYRIWVDIENQNGVLKVETPQRFFLYECLQQFFDNGGGDCFIVSVGTYTDTISASDFHRGLDAIKKLDEPTLILFPDAVLLQQNDLPDTISLGQLQIAALEQCAFLKDRFLIADIMMTGDIEGSVDEFRQRIGANELKYGAAYFPWIYSNYSHQFHFRDFSFYRYNDLGDSEPISDVFSLTSSLNTEAAIKQRMLIEEASLRNKEVEDIIQAINLSGLDRNHFGILASEFEHRVEALKQAEATELPTALEDFLSLLRHLTHVFPKLDAIVQPDLHFALTQIKVNTQIKILEKIKTLIALEKREEIRQIIDPTRGESEVNDDYSMINNTRWIDNETRAVEDIGAFPNDGVEGIPSGTGLEVFLEKLMPIGESLIKQITGLYEISLALESQAETNLFNEHPLFRQVAIETRLHLKKLPPSGTMAGIYAATDRDKGIWKAPANIRVDAILGPVISFDDRDQENFNIHPSGKSINIIRPFRGRGTRVWGARTLDGNSNEWRYVPVRRYFNYVEELVKKASEPFVFESNDSNTWNRVRSMLTNFFINHWRQGALAGATPDEAFFVNIGLGETMVQQDILAGRMIVEIGLAVSRPIEFIVIRYICRIEEN